MLPSCCYLWHDSVKSEDGKLEDDSIVSKIYVLFSNLENFSLWEHKAFYDTTNQQLIITYKNTDRSCKFRIVFHQGLPNLIYKKLGY